MPEFAPTCPMPISKVNFRPLGMDESNTVPLSSVPCMRA